MSPVLKILNPKSSFCKREEKASNYGFNYRRPILLPNRQLLQFRLLQSSHPRHLQSKCKKKLGAFHFLFLAHHVFSDGAFSSPRRTKQKHSHPTRHWYFFFVSAPGNVSARIDEPFSAKSGLRKLSEAVGGKKQAAFCRREEKRGKKKKRGKQKPPDIKLDAKTPKPAAKSNADEKSGPHPSPKKIGKKT